LVSFDSLLVSFDSLLVSFDSLLVSFDSLFHHSDYPLHMDRCVHLRVSVEIKKNEITAGNLRITIRANSGFRMYIDRCESSRMCVCFFP